MERGSVGIVVALPLNAVANRSSTLEHDGERPQKTVPTKHLCEVSFGAYVPFAVERQLLLFEIFNRGLVLEQEFEMEFGEHSDQHTQNHSDDEDQN